MPLALLGLAAGLAAGLVAGRPVEAISVAAALWVNALRMIVLPLVTSLIVTSAGGLPPRQSGRRLAQALLLFAALHAGAALIALLVAPVAFGALEIPAAEREALRAQWSVPGKAPSFATWVLSLVPANPMAAAAEGNLLAVIVFALATGLALAALPEAQARPLLDFFRSLAAAMQVILGWVLRVLPLGVFALAFQLAAAGKTAAGALGFYVMVSVGIFVTILAALYVFVAATGVVPLREFARVAWPAQVVAFTSRSSFAAMPLLVTAAGRLPLDAERAGLVLPLAMSLLRISAPASQLAALVFAARLSNVPFDAAALALAAVVAVLLSFSVTGVPNASFLVMMPLFATMGVPVEAIGLLLAADLIPDLAKTVANVTAHLAAVACLSARATIQSTAR